MSEEVQADQYARAVLFDMAGVRREVKKLEAKTLREVARGAKQLAAECEFWIPVRLEQGGGKSQHAKQASAGK